MLKTALVIPGFPDEQTIPAFPVEQMLASWYSVASCKREGTTGIMKNGSKLDDTAFTCASRYYPIGTCLIVENRANCGPKMGMSTVVVVTDLGPAKKYYRKGIKIDLSKAAFAAIADLKTGIIPVKVTVLNKKIASTYHHELKQNNRKIYGGKNDEKNRNNIQSLQKTKCSCS